ncbi:hypothetical protein TNCV_1786281 [Trichonephila clavipes]|nr:hypothetical protein TNCV_1786281 [Trichonephila clavipes]
MTDIVILNPGQVMRTVFKLQPTVQTFIPRKLQDSEPRQIKCASTFQRRFFRDAKNPATFGVGKNKARGKFVPINAFPATTPRTKRRKNSFHLWKQS